MSEKPPPQEKSGKVIDFKEASERLKEKRESEEQKKFAEGWGADAPLEGIQTFPRQSLYGEEGSIMSPESFTEEDAILHAERVLNFASISAFSAHLDFREEAELGEDVSDEEVATMFENERLAGHQFLESTNEQLPRLKQYLENDLKKEGAQISRPRILAVAERYLALIKGR